MRHPSFRAVLFASLILPLAFGPAQGQALRSVVVPADAPVAVPPRGQPMPTRIGLPAVPAGVGTPPPPGVAVAAAPTAAPAGTAFSVAVPLGLAAGPGLLLPLAATMLLGGALAGGGGGGTGAPAVTR